MLIKKYVSNDIIRPKILVVHVYYLTSRLNDVIQKNSNFIKMRKKY